jgi:hypothetical protein
MIQTEFTDFVRSGATICNTSGESTIGFSYETARRWITDNRFMIVGPNREIYLGSPATEPAGRHLAPVFFIHAAYDYSVNPGNILDARLEKIGKPHRLKNYPPIGRTPR